MKNNFVFTIKTIKGLGLLVVLFFSISVTAGKEKYSSNASTKSGSSTLLNNSTVLIVQDPYYIQYALSSGSNPWPGAGLNPGMTPNTFFDRSIKNRVVFSIDHSDKNFNGNIPYTATINFKVIYSIYNNSLGAFQNISQNKSLTLSSNQAAVDNDKAVYEFIGGNNLQVQVTGISFSNSLINLTNARVQLEAEIDLERYYFFDPNTAYSTSNLSHCSANMSITGELTVFWKALLGAEEYELEWVHINNYNGNPLSSSNHVLNPSTIIFDEKLFDFNATRITTGNNYYVIPYIYEKGYLLYRIRALGRTAQTGWTYNIPGVWSIDMTNSSAPTNVGLFVNKFPDLTLTGGCNINETFFGLNEGLNWQSSISYAEEGKSKAVVNYSDGSLRTRQSVTKLKSKNDIIIGEIVYDFQGRPAINILPVPSNTQKIEYTPNFNMAGANNVFDAKDFDYDAGICAASSPPLVNISGASNFYSAANPNKTNENSFIPDASGYPYTQTEFLPDNTGRIRSQSGVGIDHKIGTDRETKYFYGTPEQKDLDRLFGSEVGDALRYKKNMVIDANGQTSITYLDPLGKTIVTTLAGNNPASMAALGSQGSNLTTYDLLNKTIPGDNSGSLNLLDLQNKTISLNKTLLVPTNSPYTFTYDVVPPKYVESCNGSLTVPPNTQITVNGTKCYNCILDTKITLKNECGEDLFSTIFPSIPPGNFTSTGAIDSTCNSTPNPSLHAVFTPNDPSNTVSVSNLKPGSYVLEKTLSVNQAALDLYTRNYLDTLLNPCILNFSDFKNAQNVQMDISGCGLTCATCLTQLGAYAQYSGSNCQVCMTQEEYDVLLKECQEMCDESSSKCENALAQMLSDMSPSGQYGQYSPSGGSTSSGNIIIPNPSNVQPWLFPLSVFNENNQLPYKGAINGIFQTPSTAFPLFYGSSANYSPNWKHPYNPNEINPLKKFSYLDEFKNVVYVDLTPSGTNYIPAVHPIHLTKVVTMSGQFKIEPRYLQNVADFINAWEAEWAYSLIAWHPEYMFYERCLQDMPSHNFDASYVEKDKVVDAVNYVQSLNSSNTNTDFMFPVGQYNGSTWVGNVVDPYFITGSNGLGQLPNIRNHMLNFMKDPASNNYITIWDATYRIVHCPNGITGGLCPTTPIPAGYIFNTDQEWQTFRGLYASLKQTYQDRVNTIYGMNNTSYNQCIGASPFDPFENNFYDPSNNLITYNFTFYSFWSGSPFNWPWWPWAVNIQNMSEYNNPEQTCNQNKHVLYSNKQARFPTMKMLMPDAFSNGGSPCYDDQNNIIPCPQSDLDIISQMGNQADLAMFQNCGQCPTAVNFEQLFKALATLSTTASQQDLTNSSSPGVKLTCAPNTSLHKEFTIEMAKNLFGPTAPLTDVYWKYDNTNSTNLFLKGEFTHNSTNCVVGMLMPSVIVPAPGAPTYTISNPPLFTNYMPFNNMYTFADIVDVCCLKHNPSTVVFPGGIGAQNGTQRFTAIATVLCKTGDPLFIATTNPTYRQIVIEGYVGCIDFKNCNFNNVCKPSLQIKRLQNLLNALLFKNPTGPSSFAAAGDIHSTTDIQLTNNAPPSNYNTPYNAMMQPDLINDLNNVIAPTFNNLSDPWFWVKDATSSTSNKLVGTIKPLSTSPTNEQCQVSLELPANPPFTMADLLKITGIKPDNATSAPVGAFTAYGLFKNTSATPATQWLSITGTVSCLNAGSCGQEVSGNFQLNQGTGETNFELGTGLCIPQELMFAVSNFVTNFLPEQSTTSNSVTGSFLMPNSSLCTMTFVIANTGSNNSETNINIQQIINVNSVIAIPNGGLTAQTNSLLIVATVTTMVGTTVVTQTITLNGTTSCPLAFCPPPSSCKNVGNILANSDFEQGVFGFGSDYTYSPSTSLATATNITPLIFPFSPSNAEKKYNVYSIKPTFNSTPPTTIPVWVSDHTGVLFNNPMPTYFAPSIAGNGNALAARSEVNVDSTSISAAKVGYVWNQYVNLAPNQNYTFKAYYRGVPPFLSDTTQINTIVAELYINGVFKQAFFNDPNNTAAFPYTTLAYKSWNPVNYVFNSGSSNLSNVHVGLKIYYAKVDNFSTIQPYTPGDGRMDDLFLLDDVSLEGCMVGNSMACNVPPSFEEDEEDDCLNDAENTAFESAEYLYQQYMDSLRKAFQANYIAKCLNVYEDFFMKCNDSEHHFTLYYYDQAGNLIKTVPPQGVTRIPDNDPKLAQIRLDRKNNTQTVFSDHTYASTYRYNSLNQLVSQSVPDNRDLAIWNTGNFSGVNSSYNIQSVSFNGTSGFLVANDGVNGYLYAFNATLGTWIQIPSLNVSTLNSVVYIGTSSIAYVVGKNGAILRTNNNGVNWNIMPFAENTAELIKVFQYNTTGLAVAYDKNGNEYVSNLAGSVWTKNLNVFGLTAGESLKDVDFDYTTGAGLAASNFGRIYTFNGTTWILNNNNYAQLVLNKVDAGGTYLYAVGKDGTILRSTNNGVNWTEIQSDAAGYDFIDASFYGQFAGFLLGNNNTVYQTFNGANNLLNVTASGGPSSAIDIDIINSLGTLYVLNNSNTIHKYTYTGFSPIWGTMPGLGTLPSGTQLQTIATPAANAIYAGGNNGVFYVYNGTSWASVVNLPSGFNTEAVKQMSFKTSGSITTGYLLTVSGKLFFYDSSLSTPLAQASVGPYSTINFNGTDGFAVSTTGDVSRYNGTALVSGPTPANANADFRSAFFTSSNNLVMVGANSVNNNFAEITVGSPLLTNPGYSTKSKQTTPLSLNAVTTQGGGLIAGHDGTVLKFNSGLLQWETQVTASNTQLNTIVALGNDIIAAGLKGTTTGGFDHIVYSTNNGSNWLNTQNTVADYYSSKIVGSSVYFGGLNRTLSSTSVPPGAQTGITTSTGTEKLLGITSDASSNVTAVGESGLIYYGNTSGTTLQGNLNPPILNDIKWFDNTHVIAVGNNGQVIASDNAGITWKVIPLTIPTTNNFNALDILDANTALAVGDNNTIYHISYTCTGPNCTYAATTYSVGTSSSGNLSDISIKNNKVIVVDNLGVAFYQPMYSSPWQVINTLVSGLKSVYMVDNTFAYAVGANAAMVRINPSSATFNTPPAGVPVPSPLTAPVNLNDVYFKDYGTGYAVGNSGKVLKTISGGNSWTLENTPVSASSSNINVITIVNNSLVIGASGGASGSIVDNKDEMSSRFYYDKLGRLVTSQNSRQYAKNPLTYSYTKYDDLGRIIEVGEILATSPIEAFPGTNNGQVDLSDYSNWLISGAFTEVTKTYYSNPATLPTTYDGAGTFSQLNLRNRVAFTTYQDNGSAISFDHATYYSYDVHGNVNSLYQYNATLPAGNQFKRVDYDYDLISGKVNNVYYQQGKKDQFSHFYNYDDDNRITNVLTSKDGVIWDQDAKYFYYRHGPMARSELGDNKVQGTDYSYTLHGWIKGVNSDKISYVNDQGHDAIPMSATTKVNNFVSRDALGYHLGYYNNDYTSIDFATTASTDYFLADKTGSPLAAATQQLFNGNISSAGYSIKKLVDLNGLSSYRSAAYGYDQLNRLKATANFNNFDATNNKYTTPTVTNAFDEQFSYDANGNITTLQRKDDVGSLLDDLTYKYYNITNGNNKNTNQLGAAQDVVAPTSFAGDIESGQLFNSSAKNYEYDNIGNLVKDLQEEIANIEWTVYGKIKRITRENTSNKPDLEFNYDAAGNRVCKIAKTKSSAGVLDPPSQWLYTYYERDAQGNVMAVYDRKPTNSGNLYLGEQHVYGSSRIGMLTRNEDMTTAYVTNDVFERRAGDKSFEMSNHLGNVLTVVSDRKIQVDDGTYSSTGVQTSGSADGTVDYFNPDILNASDYYAFGSPMPGRQFNSNSYRYGFNGKENDNEVKGNGNQQDYGLRIYDPRIGKFLSVDPLTKDYPMLTPYQFASNRPIDGIDLDGAEWQPTDDKGNDVATDANNISSYRWVGYNSFAYQNADGSISKYRQSSEARQIGVGAPEGSVPTGYAFGDNWARKYTSNQYNQSGTIELSVLDNANQEKVSTLHPEFKKAATKLVLLSDLDLKISLKITDANRTNAEQDALYAKGRTTGGKKVTNAKGGQSLHNFGIAIDVAGLKKSGGLDYKINYPALGILGESLGLEWGGRWLDPVDKPHFQLPYTLRQLQSFSTGADGNIILPK